MQTSISKRLLAGLLSIVMVLSLFVATPAKTEASITNRNVCTIELATRDRDANGDLINLGTQQAPDYQTTPGVVYNHIKGDLVLEEVSLGDQDVSDIDYCFIYSVNNGTFNLDADDKMENMAHQILIMVYPHNMDTWKDLEAVQVKLGGAASASAKNGYELAEFVIGEGYVLIAINTTKQATRIAQGDIMSLKTNIAYQYYFPTALNGFKTLHFTTGALTWMRVEGEVRNPGDHATDPYKIITAGKITYPTYPILGSATDKTSKLDYYAVSTVISAEVGYDLPANGYYEAADGRVFQISDRSKDGTTAKLTILFIYPQLTSDFANVGVTSIELKRQLNFGTGDGVLCPADVIKYLPTSFDVVINGEKKTIPMTTLKNKRAHWVIYTMSGSTLVPMPETEKFEQTNYDEATTGVWTGLNPEYVYYARLEMVVSDPTDSDYWDPYTVATGEDYMPMAYDLFYAGAEDVYGLLDTYCDDINDDPNRKGWTIEFTVNKGREAGGTTTIDVPAYMTADAPQVNFYGYVNNGEALYTAFAVGQGTTTFKMYNTEVEGYWNQADAWMNVPSDQKLPHLNADADKNGRVYKAFSELGYGNFTVKSPFVYTYFNPVKIYSPELKAGSISISVVEPIAYKEVSYLVNGAAADKDLANGLMLEPEDIYLVWDGEILSGDNTGKEQFVYGEEYTAYVLIPVKPGYKLTFTPEVRINGNKAEAEIYEEDGVVYVLAAYTWKTEEKPGNIIKTGAQKKLARFGLNKPFAGAPVQKKLTLTDSAARFYEFINITWYENGVEFDGDTFAKGKRYTAVVTLDASKGGVTEDCTDGLKMVATQTKYMVNAKALVSTQELVITYEFPAAELPKYESANNIIIEVPNGMKEANFYEYVASQLFVTVNFVGGTTGLLPVDFIETYRGTQAMDLDPETLDDALNITGSTWADVVEMAMGIEYPGLTGYNENSAKAQSFELLGVTAIAGRGYSETTGYASYSIIIKVAGAKSALKFDANGGVYTGTGCSPEIGKAYGFKYDPNEIYREGYFFAGWYDAATGGNRIYASTIADGKIKTLYAHWVKVFTGKVWTLKAVSYSAGRLTVTASGIKTKCDGYEFSISKDGITWTTVSQVKNVKYFTGLAAGSYTVRVRAYRRDSAGKLVYGAYTTVKSTVK